MFWAVRNRGCLHNLDPFFMHGTDLKAKARLREFASLTPRPEEGRMRDHATTTSFTFFDVRMNEIE